MSGDANEITVTFRDESLIRLLVTLQSLGCTICPKAISVFEDPELQLTPPGAVKKPFRFRIVSVADLGATRKTNYEQLVGLIDAKGLWCCLYPDMVLHLLKQMPERKDRQALCVPCTAPLHASGTPVFLMAEKSVGRFFLDTRVGGPSADFEPRDLLVLLDPR